jgi:hypothetical protein
MSVASRRSGNPIPPRISRKQGKSVERQLEFNSVLPHERISRSTALLPHQRTWCLFDYCREGADSGAALRWLSDGLEWPGQDLTLEKLLLEPGRIKSRERLRSPGLHAALERSQRAIRRLTWKACLEVGKQGFI